MTGLSLLTADMRRAEKRGPKILIVGIPGVGKTSLLGALAPETLGDTLLVDAEAGDLAVAGLPIASVRPRTWPDLRDVACVLGAVAPGASPPAGFAGISSSTAAVSPGVMTPGRSAAAKRRFDRTGWAS